MNRSIYTKLAISNLKNNRKTYIPYVLTAILTVMMYYMMANLAANSPMNQEALQIILSLSVHVIEIFALIFLFYTNSFLIKRRKREIGVYHILGMGKPQLAKMLVIETVVTGAVSILGGIFFGTALAKLMYALLKRMIHYDDKLAFRMSWEIAGNTVLFFTLIFALTLIYNLLQIRLANPIDLLHAGSQGEREPKTKWFLTMAGIIFLGIGYYIAITTKEPLKALQLFFVAVICVIIGTYALFTAGSIALLKFLKSRRNFYYQPTHFTSISGLLYRMKQNAVGLANICILCTCVLVTLSSTICLYNGIQDSIDRQCYMAGNIKLNGFKNPSYVFDKTKELLKNEKYDSLYALPVYEYSGSLKKNHAKLDDYDYKYLSCINLVSLEDYNHYFDKNLSLDKNEIYLYSYGKYNYRSLSLNGNSYVIKDQIKNRQVQTGNSYAFNAITIIMNQNNLDQYQLKPQIFFIGFNASKEVVKNVTNQLLKIDYSQLGEKNYYFTTQNGIEDQELIYEMYGSILFIGIFLSIMFLVAAIIIIYNKQISEGFEDQNKFEILQNVGMSQKEVKQTIQFQVLIFFFVPLIVAIIHLLFAYPLILKVLNGLLLCNENVYFISTISCIISLIIIYTIVYLITSKAYYRIVKK